MGREIKDLAASVRQRLYNNAKTAGRPFQEVLEYFAMERFLYRLSTSPHVERLILKGALMFVAWHAPSTRPTRDIDFLARMNNSADAVLPIVRDICTRKVAPDGLIFDAETINAAVIKEDADYEGVRVTFLARLQNAEVPMQLDLGFGDVLTSAPVLTDYPTILDFAAPRLYGYSRETAIAEKFEAMAKLGQLNSRMKDFFDIWLLSRQFEFDGTILATAIQQTFAHRNTSLDLPPFALTPAFATDTAKLRQWAGFLKRSRLSGSPQEFASILDMLAVFLLPVAAAVRDGQAFKGRWFPPGPWIES